MAALAPPTLPEVEHAATVLAEVLRPTPLLPLGEHLLLKPEVLQPTGSFKIRGVFHAVSCFTAEQRARGISTVSAGNTAKALAWSGRHFGVEARSLMPDHAPRTKIDAVEAYGGTAVLRPMPEVFEFLKGAGWEDEPYAFVHPWIGRDVLIGHGTLGLEILAQCPEVETVYLPVGGGGLLGGVGSALKAARPDVRIVAVEPAGCPSLHASLAAGKPMEVECNTMCDGVAVPYMTEEAFPLLASLVERVVLVSEQEVRATIRKLAASVHLVAEGAGALATAAAMIDVERGAGMCVAPITGGSIDASTLAEVLAEG